MGLNNCKDRNGAGEYVEGIVCKEKDISENEMKVCDIGTDGGKVLIVKKNGQLSALGTKCSHYGAPLASGALGEGRIRCPWHGACFNLQTGDIEDFPGLDSIPCYHVEVTPDGGVKVRAKISELKANKRLKPMVALDQNNNNSFVIIGGGAAGQVCAETLRQEGYTGKLTMITADKFSPYDRIKLSKQLDIAPSTVQLRPADFYKEHAINLMLETQVISVNTETHTVALSNGQNLNYTSLFIATGSIPRKIDLPGSDLENIFTLRSITDANRIFQAISSESEVIVYGSSFIGMEAAAFCVSKVKKVTVVGRSDVPFAESFGEVIGQRVAKLFQDKGVILKMKTTITSFQGDSAKKVKEVKLSDGMVLKADVVILGLGSNFATNFLKETAIRLNDNGSVPVNKFLETSCSGVFAGGDIAEAPLYAVKDGNKSIGHWGLAHYHGRIAALNMMSQATPLKAVPFFWTMLFGVGFRYAGYGSGYDDIVIGGDLETLKFACYYCKGDKVIAVTTVGTDPIAAQFSELLSSGKTLEKSLVQSNPLAWFKN